MVWHIGIDEAGYGPNLGPLVMTSVACQAPDGVSQGDLWKLLKQAVRRPKDKDDGRILVEDSKVLYGPATGLACLEKSVLAFLHPSLAPAPSLAPTLAAFSPASLRALASEHWYTGQTALPLQATADDVQTAAGRFAAASEKAGVTWGLVRSVVVCASKFNDVVERCNSKGAVLGLEMVELLRDNLGAVDASRIEVLVDKHGGRNQYSAILQTAFDGDMVISGEESAYRSAYRVMNRDIEVAFEPRADSKHFCVALASMISKYFREAMMHEFNQFWRLHVPDLKPTAGYPGDSERFFNDIRPAVKRLGIARECLWRAR